MPAAEAMRLYVRVLDEEAPGWWRAVGAVGSSGIGAGVATAIFAARENDPAALEEALDELLEDPEFIAAVADEALYSNYADGLEDVNGEVAKLRDELLSSNGGGN